MDLNYAQMARVLRVPDEKFRDKMVKSMEQWVTSLKRELGESPPPGRAKEAYVEEFQRLLGVKLARGEPSEEERRVFWEETLPRHISREWLNKEAPRGKPGRAVKIAHDVKVVEADHKAGKLIRLGADVKGTEILDLRITGDLFVVPKEAVAELEAALIGARLEEDERMRVITRFYGEKGPESPGIGPRDYVDANLPNSHPSGREVVLARTHFLFIALCLNDLAFAPT